MIKIKNLSKNYYEQRVVDNLSLEIKDGSIFGFLGPNGAGKTTTMKMIVGLCPIDNGSVEVGGKSLQSMSGREIIGYMPEEPYFYDKLSALEFLRFMSSLFPNSNSTIQQFNNLLNTVGLQNVGKKRIADFSKGMKQRLGLAQALVNDPRYLFLDEPLDGLDPIGRLEFKEILLDLKKQCKTIFFNSHILADVEEICDRIGIINAGKLIYSGDVKSFCKGQSLEKQFVRTITSK